MPKWIWFTILFEICSIKSFANCKIRANLIIRLRKNFSATRGAEKLAVTQIKLPRKNPKCEPICFYKYNPVLYLPSYLLHQSGAHLAIFRLASHFQLPEYPGSVKWAFQGHCQARWIGPLKLRFSWVSGWMWQMGFPGSGKQPILWLNKVKPTCCLNFESRG